MHQFQCIKQQQEQLGWKKMYYGRITSAWANSITTSQQTIKGVVFYSRVIILVWKAVVEQWTLYNKHLHPPNAAMEDCTQLTQMVYHILQETQADPALQDMVMAFDPEVLLS